MYPYFSILYRCFLGGKMPDLPSLLPQLLVMCLLSLSTVSQASSQACQSVYKNVETLLEQKVNTVLRKNLSEQYDIALAVCTQRQSTVLGRYIAEAIFDDMQAQGVFSDQQSKQMKTHIDNLHKAFTPIWQGTQLLGYYDLQNKAYDQAVMHLQKTLYLMEDYDAHISDQTIRETHAQLSIALNLAKQPLKSTQMRGQSDEWIVSKTSFRGVSVVPIPLPVHFQTNSTELSHDGRQIVEQWVKELQQMTVPLQRITLTGHADERGDAAFNLRLSMRRAQVVKDYFLRSGITAKIIVDGKGEEQPYPEKHLSTALTQEERWQLDRRVEWSYQ